LLDPANGRLDIVPGKNRKSGGFSRGFPGVTTVFFTGGFEGYYNDMRVLMHESTHAIHRQLMNNNRVLPAYAAGPHYLFESFAIFHELLLPDFLYQQETDLSRRRYYLEQFFEGKGMALFFVAQDAALEQAIFDGVGQGAITDAHSLELLTKQINAPYSIWSDDYNELNMRWMTDSLFYEDPLYEINYVYGSLLALNYYELFERDREGFVPRYIDLMKHGFDAPPADLLARFLKLDLDNTGLLVESAVQFLERKLQLLEAVYSE
jgi:oligoendopeptidase F